MKNFPGIVKISVLTAIAVMAILTIQACCMFEIKNGMFALIITFPQQVTGEKEFCKALHKLSKKANYHFHFVRDDGSSRDFDSPRRMTIKTDRVIKTELATSLSKDEFTAIGSNITHHLYSPDAMDLGRVLNEIKKK